ncbi:MAG: ABC transporter permease [Tetrasphaera sp.]
MGSADAARDAGVLSADERALISGGYGTVNLILCALVGMAVIGGSTSLVVTSRRGSIARLLLGGMTPGQLTRMLTIQIAVVALVTGAIGAVLAALLARPVIAVIAKDPAVTLLTMFGAALSIAVAGSVGNLVMMSRQRSAELALDGVVGATPRQQVLVPLFEALIITVTTSVLGLIMAITGGLLISYGLGRLNLDSSLAIPWALLAMSVAVCGVVVALATTVPALASLRQPAPKSSRGWSPRDPGVERGLHATGHRRRAVTASESTSAVVSAGVSRLCAPRAVAVISRMRLSWLTSLAPGS